MSAPDKAMDKVELSEQEINDFREVFNLMDRDKGGTLGMDEIKHLMDMLGMRVRPDELEGIMKQVDTDGSGQVDFDEFLQVMVRPQTLPYTRKDVMRAFEMFRSGSEPEGCIQADVLEKALITHCTDPNIEDIMRLVSSLEQSANGLIDFKTKVNMFVAK